MMMKLTSSLKRPRVNRKVSLLKSQYHSLEAAEVMSMSDCKARLKISTSPSEIPLKSLKSRISVNNPINNHLIVPLFSKLKLNKKLNLINQFRLLNPMEVDSKLVFSKNLVIPLHRHPLSNKIFIFPNLRVNQVIFNNP